MPKTSIVVHNFGVDGNSFALMGQVTQALKQGSRGDLVDEFRKEATSGNYQHLLETCFECVEIEPYESPDEDVEGAEEWEDDDADEDDE